jgi:hypothetical protein
MNSDKHENRGRVMVCSCARGLLVAGELDAPGLQKVSTVRGMPQISQLSKAAEKIWLASF